MNNTDDAVSGLKVFDDVITVWHSKESRINTWEDACAGLQCRHSGIKKLLFELGLINCFQWHEEDMIRSPVLSEPEIVRIKRSIDASNQRRVEKIEEIDSFILDCLKGVKTRPGAELNSETPGSILDRLSVLSLKIFHAKDAEKIKILKEQKADLSGCFEKLMSLLKSGKKKMKMYFHFKNYGK